MTTHPISTRHLVDEEVAPFLDVFPPLQLSAERLPEVRAFLAAPRPVDAPDPAVEFPGVAKRETTVPGWEGDPDVRVVVFEKKDKPTTSPALVWIHGGGYVFGSAEGDEMLLRRIVTETGATVVSVDYRIAPETKEPGLVHDCYSALKWVHEQADELGIDRDRIAVGGASAGGGLAATTSILARDLGEIPIRFQLLVYPMLDDRTSSTVPAGDHFGEFIWTPNDNRFGWASIMVGEPGADGVSPYTAAARVEDVAGLPPTYICVGALDLFLEEDMAYATRLMRAGVPTELHVYPGAYHAFDGVTTSRVAQVYARDLIAALDRALNG